MQVIQVKRSLSLRSLALLALVGTAGFFAATSARAEAAASCRGGVPALQFKGIDHRVVAGQKEVFGLGHRPSSRARFDGQVKIKMVARAGKGPTFFRGKYRRLSPRMAWVQFGLGDPPAKVHASYLERRPFGRSCQRRLSASVKSKDRIYLGSRCYNRDRQPNHVVVACADGNLQLGKLRPWRGWDKRKASARGVARANDCIPYCAAGHFHTYRARVRVSRPRYCPDWQRFFYRRLRIRFHSQTVHYSRSCSRLSLAADKRSGMAASSPRGLGEGPASGGSAKATLADE